MNWKNLKDHNCPACGHPVRTDGLIVTKYECSNCEFSIGFEKFNSIVSVRKYKPTFKDNQEALNNL